MTVCNSKYWWGVSLSLALSQAVDATATHFVNGAAGSAVVRSPWQGFNAASRVASSLPIGTPLRCVVYAAQTASAPAALRLRGGFRVGAARLHNDTNTITKRRARHSERAVGWFASAAQWQLTAERAVGAAAQSTHATLLLLLLPLLPLIVSHWRHATACDSSADAYETDNEGVELGGCRVAHAVTSLPLASPRVPRSELGVAACCCGGLAVCCAFVGRVLLKEAVHQGPHVARQSKFASGFSMAGGLSWMHAHVVQVPHLRALLMQATEIASSLRTHRVSDEGGSGEKCAPRFYLLALASLAIATIAAATAIACEALVAAVWARSRSVYAAFSSRCWQTVRSPALSAASRAATRRPVSPPGWDHPLGPRLVRSDDGRRPFTRASTRISQRASVSADKKAGEK